MNKCTYFLLGFVLIFNQGIVQLSAQESAQPDSAALANNKYLQENAKLIKQADDSYAQGKYEDAIKNAEEAMKNADLSDAYVNATVAMDKAQARMDWAKKTNVPKKYPEIYEQADTAFTSATDASSKEDWGKTKESALSVIDILAGIPDTPVLAAQYRVSRWSDTKDCLWNIAAKEQIYNDPMQWQRIYNANKSKFPKADDPNLIEPGMLLDIPAIGDEVRSGILEGE